MLANTRCCKLLQQPLAKMGFVSVLANMFNNVYFRQVAFDVRTPNMCCFNRPLRNLVSRAQANQRQARFFLDQAEEKPKPHARFSRPQFLVLIGSLRFLVTDRKPLRFSQRAISLQPDRKRV